jgi:invasion protein IalB
VGHPDHTAYDHVCGPARRQGSVPARDQGAAYHLPYVWCLTNTCIAADLADPRLIKEMETGQKLELEVVDSSVLAVATALPINQFAAVRQGTPTQTFEHNIDE